jgi:PhnB protein
MHYRDANSADMSIEKLSEAERNCVYHAEMLIGNQRFMFSDSIKEIPKGQNISTVVTFNDADDVKAAYKMRIEGSTVIHPMKETTYSSCFVSLVDRFGMRWELMTENA